MSANRGTFAELSDAIINGPGAKPMKATIQVFSKKGYYGPELTITSRNVESVLRKVIDKLDEVPDTVEDVQFADWTKISVTIERDDKISA